MVWDRDPAALVTPWQERPPEPGDPLAVLITYPTGHRRSALRLSAAWVCAPDGFA
ncbi:hypothetical protein [Microlunatus parietis]|uniref:Uncharacterized protein n=1 Tax=Microlunatus parietis TaxID=682979 RepID=A0A7Y9LEP8_9ACTN|nr:hypothetical protein [Microlunatus parietis]NYE73261.1 hypothetical protein [Microlunatus parietis]